MKIIRVGILGQGRSGYGIHATWLRNEQNRFKVVAVADLVPERTQECVEAFGAKAYSDYETLLADKTLNLDLIVNALPSLLHPEGTLKALKAGYDVICEKPVARTVADFDEMVATAEACGKKLLPYQNSRFQPAFQKIQEVLASGCLGKIIHARISFSGFARRWDWQTRSDMWGILWIKRWFFSARLNLKSLLGSYQTIHSAMQRISLPLRCGIKMRPPLK